MFSRKMKKSEWGKKKNFSGQAREMFASLPPSPFSNILGGSPVSARGRYACIACRLFVCRQLIREVTKQKGRNSDKQAPISFEPWAIITFSTAISRSCKTRIAARMTETCNHGFGEFNTLCFFFRQFAQKTCVLPPLHVEHKFIFKES